jgi:hypothetical protein
VNAGLRLLEASGKPEPWQNRRARHGKSQVTVGLAVVAGLWHRAVAFAGAGASRRSIAALRSKSPNSH